jgi:hypothetical protein
LYFVAAAATPLPDRVSFDVGVGMGAANRSPTSSAIEKAITRGFESLSPEEHAALETEIAEQPAVLRPLVRNLARDYPAVRSRIYETFPRALFVLVPVLALVLAVFYRRRHFPEHLYAALHLQTFVFLALAIVSVARYTRSVLVIGAATAVAALVIVGHAIVAQRRVYAESWPSTVTKAVCVAGLYAALWGTASFGAALWATWY